MCVLPHTLTQICPGPALTDCRTRESSAGVETMLFSLRSIRAELSWAQSGPWPGFPTLISAPVLLSHGANVQNCLECINDANSISILISNAI